MGILFVGSLFSGCGKNEATETANESADIENGEDEELPTEEEPEEEVIEEEPEEEEETEPALKVGISLPSAEDDARWSVDAQTMETALTDAGYDVLIRWAEEDAAGQEAQIEELMENEISALIVAPVDIWELSEVADQAKENSIPVFSYDSLIMDSAGVSYYVTFNPRVEGQLVGTSIVEKYQLDKAQEGQEPVAIEFLMGSPEDNDALFFFNGIMEILQPYFDSGVLTAPSGKVTFDDVAIMRESETAAVSELEERLDTYYLTESDADPAGEVPDIICTGSDAFALSIAEFLEERGMSYMAEEWPMLTGRGSSAEAVRNIAEGVQSSTVFADNRILAEQCASMVDVLLTDEEDPEVTDYEQFDNGIKIIRTYACEPQLIDADNYPLLIDNGYYAAEQIEPGASGENLEIPTPTPTPEPTATPAPTSTPVPTPTQSFLKK